MSTPPCCLTLSVFTGCWGRHPEFLWSTLICCTLQCLNIFFQTVDTTILRIDLYRVNPGRDNLVSELTGFENLGLVGNVWVVMWGWWRYTVVGFCRLAWYERINRVSEVGHGVGVYVDVDVGLYEVKWYVGVWRLEWDKETSFHLGPLRKVVDLINGFLLIQEFCGFIDFEFFRVLVFASRGYPTENPPTEKKKCRPYRKKKGDRSFIEASLLYVAVGSVRLASER
ncbi:hypothetical protein CsSME_00045817 [Camellia sinensis var. sinensis]